MAGAEDRQATQWQNSTRSAGGQAAERTAFPELFSIEVEMADDGTICCQYSMTTLNSELLFTMLASTCWYSYATVFNCTFNTT